MAADGSGEFDLIREYFDRAKPRDAILGIGDDCALIRQGTESLAITTDMLVSGRHFFADCEPGALGHKALAVNLSDLAAMGAKPTSFTLAISLERHDGAWLSAFCGGLLTLARQFDCELIGGDTTQGPLTITVTAIGTVPADLALRRDRAEVADDVWVSGALGGAAGGLAFRQGRAASVTSGAAIRLDRPQARVSLGLGLRACAHAAIDVSDGLVADLGHIADRSGVGVTLALESLPIDASIVAMPVVQQRRWALAGGDDYELAFTAPADQRSALLAIAQSLNLGLTRVGQIVSGRGVNVFDRSGKLYTDYGAGFDHFGSA